MLSKLHTLRLSPAGSRRAEALRPKMDRLWRSPTTGVFFSDSLPSNSNGCDTSAGLSRAFTFGIGKDDRQLGTGPLNFPSLPLILSPDESSDLDFEVHSANVNLYSLPESIPRNAGIRAALPTDEQQMTVVVPLTAKTSNHGVVLFDAY